MKQLLVLLLSSLLGSFLNILTLSNYIKNWNHLGNSQDAEFLGILSGSKLFDAQISPVAAKRKKAHRDSILQEFSVLQIMCAFKKLKFLFLHETLSSYHSLESSFQDDSNER